MTRRSILEYAQALRGRYFGASREEKGKMPDEFTKVTGLHRKAAIRLLHQPGQPMTGSLLKSSIPIRTLPIGRRTGPGSWKLTWSLIAVRAPIDN